MSSSIETVSAEAVIARLQRLFSRERNAWSDQTAQEEVNEYHQCNALFMQAPHFMYRCWAMLEERYTIRKLQAYWAHIKPLCKRYDIAVSSRKGKLSFFVPWSTDNDSNNLFPMTPAQQLAYLTRGQNTPPTASVPPAVLQQVIEQMGPRMREYYNERMTPPPPTDYGF